MLDFNKYQQEARKTAVYPDVGNNLWYPALGLAGESGEVAEKIKKIYRDKKGVVDGHDKVRILKELGDVLWYISNIASELEIEMDIIANVNLMKLQQRTKNGTVKGSGDDR